MECSFEARKEDLKAECTVSGREFASAASRLEGFMEPFLSGYVRQKQESHAVTVVRGLCSDLEHKNCESIAYLFGMDRKSIQHFIGESAWNDRPLRDELSRQVGSQLGEADGVIAFDPSAFKKSGKGSVGVARQWCGRLGKVDNCQVGVFLSYVSSKGHAIVDTDLYLPHEWTQDKARMKEAGVPTDHMRYRTRHEMCLELLDRHAQTLPHSWVTGDDELGRPAGFRRELRNRNERYLLAVPCNTTIRDLQSPDPEYSGSGRPPKRQSWRVDKWTSELNDQDWTPVDVRDGEKGPLKVEAVKRQVETGRRGRSTVAEEVFVVIRYRDRDSRIVKTDYYLSNADIETDIKEFCRAAKAEHRVEECLQRAKGQAGLGDYEVRNWVGWQHHQTLSLIASWFLTVETRRAGKKNTRDHNQSGATGNRFHHPSCTKMRYTPGRQVAHRAAAAAEPASQALSLETP